MKHVVTAFAVLTALLQGGFSDAVWSACGIACALYLCFRFRKPLPTPVMALMAALAVIYAASAIYHGLPFESWAAAGRLMTACLLLLVFYNMDADVYDTAFITGMVVAAVGYAAFCEIFPWAGAVASRRFQSVFQYSNAAGLFLGASAFLARQRDKLSPYALFLETALVLTQSVGALAVYIAAWAVFVLKNGKTRFTPVLLGLAAALLSAGIIYATVYFVGIPQLAILPAAALIVFRVKLQTAIHKAAGVKGALVVVCIAGLAAAAALFAARGLLPAGTYLERLIHISDGAMIIARNPLGIGPGFWQFFYHSYQSAPYDASILHSGYTAVGVDAGFLAVIAIILFLVYWLRRREWDDKCFCLIMILAHVAFDISFSFLTIVLIAAMLVSDTLQKPAEKPEKPTVREAQATRGKSRAARILPRIFCRVLLAIPIALLAVVFTSSALKNSAQWSAAAGDYPAASAQLERRPVRSDTEAFLMQMRWGLQSGRHDALDDAFGEMPRRNALAYAMKAGSLIERGSFHEAAEYALISAELSPHSPAGFSILEEAVSHLDTARQLEYREKISALEMGTREHPLFALIRRLETDNN